LALVVVLLVLSNLVMLAYFSIENAKLREAVKSEQLLYEEALRLVDQEREDYDSLWMELQKALKANKELEEFLVNITGKVLIPQNYTYILERG